MWKKPGQSAPFPILLSNSKPRDGQLLDTLPNSWESAIPQVRHIESAPKINLFIITTYIGILIIFQYMHYNFFLVKVLKRLKCSDLLGVNYIFTHRSWGVGLWFKVQSNFFYFSTFVCRNWNLFSWWYKTWSKKVFACILPLNTMFNNWTLKINIKINM